MHVEVSNLCKEFVTRYGAFQALKNINMYVNQGEFVCVVGSSGCGKSTLLRLIAGLDMPTTGTIAIDGASVVGPGKDRGMIFQNYTLYPWLTVADNVAFGLKLQGVPKAERRQQTASYLDLVGLSAFAGRYPKALSGGMKQRVAIARALVCQPQILLLDEPFGALDVQTKETMQELLLHIWQRTRSTILMITHDIAEAIFLAQRVYVLTKQPGTVQHEITIHLPGKHTYQTRYHPDFQAYHAEIYHALQLIVQT